MRSFLSRNWKTLAPIGAVLGAAAIYLAFFVFGVQTYFFDSTVDEAGPVFASGAGEAVDETGTETGTGTGTGTSGGTETEIDGGSETGGQAETETVVADTPADVTTIVSGSFVDRDHPASGTALVLGDGSDQRFLRFEDFATDNGPDLNVYLSTASSDAPAGEFDDDFVDLGDLKGNIGDQNYEIPADVDLDRYTTVVIWCVRFGVAFGAADRT